MVNKTQVDDGGLFEGWYNGEDVGIKVPPISRFDEFTSLEDLLSSFDLTKITARDNNNFLRKVIRLLSEENPFLNEYLEFLSEVDPRNIANYLAPALGNTESREAAKLLFKKYGPIRGTIGSRGIIGPLIGALGNLDSVDVVKEIFVYYGPSRDIVRPLVSALIYPQRRNAVISILQLYGPNKATVEALVGSLQNDETKEYAKEILIDYGRDALRYLRIPKSNSKLYKPLIRIIDKIKGKI